jgi:hypothetical protein
LMLNCKAGGDSGRSDALGQIEHHKGSRRELVLSSRLRGGPGMQR